MATYPTGLGAANAIALVQNRTGQTSGLPTPAVILTFLNEAIEYVERRLGAVFANDSITIAQGSDSVALPPDMQEIINVNYSVSLPTTTNAVLYPIQLVQEGAFERLVGFAPGQSSGYPTLAFIQSDASGVMTLQLYPVIQTAGFINLYYKQRPALFADTTNNSVTNVDSMYQEAMITWACKAVCENRSQFGQPVQYFQGLFDKVLEQIKEDQALRQIPGRNRWHDVMGRRGPYWYALNNPF